jgi:hypothetical protein
MKPGEDRKARPPNPTTSPLDGTSESGSSGSGAQTALLEMLRKRRMRVTRDPDSEIPSDDPPCKLRD